VTDPGPRPSPGSGDVELEAAPRRRSRTLRWSVAVGLVVIVLYVAALVTAPLMPKLKVTRGGWRLYRCHTLGGSIPPDFDGMVRIERGFTTHAPSAVFDGNTVYVARAVTDAGGQDLEVAVWSATYDYGGPFHPVRATNDVARQVAGNPDGVDDAPSPGAVDAAAACAERNTFS